MNEDKLIIVKIGSSVLVQKNNILDYTRIANIVHDIIKVQELSNYKFIIVTSGAVSSGRVENLDLKKIPC